MYSDGNGMNLNSIEMLEYIELDDLDMMDQYRNQNLNRNRLSNNFMTNKIKIKAYLAIIRLVMLYFFFYLDNSQMTFFLKNLIGFLLIHEALVLTNYTIVMVYKIGSVIITRREADFPSFCAYLDIFNNFLFFTWFVYGNLCILTDKTGIDESLIQNKMLTYYITVMILLGFFIYSKLIFYIIFFISFCPCITYVLCFDVHQEYKNSRRATRIHQRLKEETYEEFASHCGITLDNCIICTNEFSEKENVINLPCNFKHTFHASCIRQWIDKRPICPLCRLELRSSDEETSPVQNMNEYNRNVNNLNNRNTFLNPYVPIASRNQGNNENNDSQNANSQNNNQNFDRNDYINLNNHSDHN